MFVLLFTVMYTAVISIFVFNAKTPLSVYRYVICVYAYVYIHCGKKNISILRVQKECKH